MRSESPNIIRHNHIHLSFSKQMLDYKESAHNKIMQTDDNPFRNKKLKHIENNKECIMIFKNKSAKKFRAKKQIQTIPLLQNMKNTKNRCIVMREKEKQRYNIMFQVDPYSNIKTPKKPASSLHSRRASSSPQINPQRGIQTSYSSFRGTSRVGFFDQNMFIMSNQLEPSPINIRRSQQFHKMSQSKIHRVDNKMRSTFSGQSYNYSNNFQRSPSIQFNYKFQNKNYDSLRITGNRAPSNQTIDSWKRHTVDGFYQFVNKLVK